MSEAPQFDPSVGQRHIIERPRLLKLLDETEAKIILLVAPAGYGKTTLARQWMAGKVHAWYRVTSASRDPAALAMAVLAAAQRGSGDFEDGRLAGRLSAASAPTPSPGVLAQLLLADVQAVGTDWLVLDDLHALDGALGAQQLMAEVVDRLPLRVLGIARSRPPWATSRRVMYGEILEVETSSLAMSATETAAVLGTGEAVTPDFLARVAGWPAVIGLAAVGGKKTLPDVGAPQPLYDFLARELHADASAELRAQLVTLAIVQRISKAGEESLLISSSLVSEAMKLGIVVPASSETCEMHPLMREYILRTPSGDDEVLTSCSRIFAAALSQDDWETALDAVRISRDNVLLAELIESKIDDMLGAGRLETLRSWDRLARELGCDAPIASLLRAELAFRDGQYAKSALEAGVASRTSSSAPRRFQALSTVARAEYFADNNAGAIGAYRLALEVASTPRERADALRGLVLAGVALDEQELDQHWNRYSSLSPADAPDAIRRAATELHVAYFRGRLTEALEAANLAKDLLRDVRDPMIRTGFLNTFAHTLMLAGRFREGESAARTCLAELLEYGLDFGLVHVHLDLARAAIALKHYGDAAALLEETRATLATTVFTRLSCDAQLTRIAIIRGGDAQPLPTRTPRADVNSYAEVLATRALYEAVRGEPQRVAALCRRADRVTHSAEVRVLAAWARALSSIALGHDNARSYVRIALRRAMRSGVVDSLVIAYRAAPQLLNIMRAVASDAERESLIRLLTQADDDLLARAHGMNTHALETPLTPREAEVLHLIAAGLSNRDIAAQLFISLATAKVHVRHIMEKLDARSRTEAAMKGLGLAR